MCVFSTVKDSNMFCCELCIQDITRCMRDEVKDDSMAGVIQTVVKQGIERIELRDEILCQLIRQSNDNPDTASLVLVWLFMCLCTASFTPSKNLHKVGRVCFCIYHRMCFPPTYIQKKLSVHITNFFH